MIQKEQNITRTNDGWKRASSRTKDHVAQNKANTRTKRTRNENETQKDTTSNHTSSGNNYRENELLHTFNTPPQQPFTPIEALHLKESNMLKTNTTNTIPDQTIP